MGWKLAWSPPPGSLFSQVNRRWSGYETGMDVIKKVRATKQTGEHQSILLGQKSIIRPQTHFARRWSTTYSATVATVIERKGEVTTIPKGITI